MYSERMRQKQRNEVEAEAKGLIADSMGVRKALMEKFHAGEATLEEVQAELTAIKKNAKKNGQVTRNQARNGNYQEGRPERITPEIYPIRAGTDRDRSGNSVR